MVRIGLITPWGKGIRCGIRTYSESLIMSLASLGAEVYVIRWPRFGRRTPELVSMIIDRIAQIRGKIDLLHFQNEYGLLYPDLERVVYPRMRQFGMPVVTTMHAVGNYVIDSIVAANSDGVIVHNRFCQDRFGFPSTIIPHGCSSSSCQPRDQAKISLGIDPQLPVVGYLGFIAPTKGLETLIAAMGSVPRSILLIGGGWHLEAETEYIARLKEDSTRTLPGRVRWLGYVEDFDLPRVYGAMDLFCYPPRYATESGALLQAIGFGKAVLASAIGPFKEKSDLGVIATFRPGDAGDLADRIRWLLSSPGSLNALEDAARRYASSISWENVARAHIDLYERLLNTFQPRKAN